MEDKGFSDSDPESTDGKHYNASISDRKSEKQLHINDSFSIISGALQVSDNVEASMAHLNIWDQLMAARIKLQSAMKFSNAFVMRRRNIVEPEVKKAGRKSFKRIVKIQEHLEEMLISLQTCLNGADKRTTDEEIWESILQQWWMKTCDTRTSKLGNKGNFSQLEESPVKYAQRLLSDKESLLQRSKLKRVHYSNEAPKSNDEYDDRIFDDNDFYQVQVRDVISKKLARTTDPTIVSSTITSGEKLTGDIIKPKKTNVDRKASKGRKLRYNIMPKLVQYMGPNDTIRWSEQQRDELFRSLFQNV